MKYYWTSKVATILLTEGAKLAISVIIFVWETEA